MHPESSGVCGGLAPPPFLQTLGHSATRQYSAPLQYQLFSFESHAGCRRRPPGKDGSVTAMAGLAPPSAPSAVLCFISSLRRSSLLRRSRLGSGGSRVSLLEKQPARPPEPVWGEEATSPSLQASVELGLLRTGGGRRDKGACLCSETEGQTQRAAEAASGREGRKAGRVTRWRRKSGAAGHLAVTPGH